MPKNIVICCDGTGNEFGKNNTNVVKLYQFADKSDPSKQITYYDPGVATGGWKYDTFIIGFLWAKRDGATGSGLQKNVEDAYKYLMRCYEDGDKIYLFGFSRGAFTVRSLAGMLHKCGLLHVDMFNMVKSASKMYNNKNNDTLAADFKKTFSRKCPVHFIGVWDTVKSLALNAGRRFHDSTLNSEVHRGYHAVALDEVRKKFPPDLWIDRERVEQVWFAGVHSDVGGWYNKAGLSDIALKWMADKAKKEGMYLDDKQVDAIKGDPLGMQHVSDAGFLWILIRIFRGRHIRQLPFGAKVHKSVKERLGQTIRIGNDKSEEKGKRPYKPMAQMDGENLGPESKVEWVD